MNQTTNVSTIMNSGNKLFKKWILSCNRDKRKERLNQVQEQLAKSGLRGNKLRSALSQLTRCPKVVLKRLTLDQTNTMHHRQRSHGAGGSRGQVHNYSYPGYAYHRNYKKYNTDTSNNTQYYRNQEGYSRVLPDYHTERRPEREAYSNGWRNSWLDDASYNHQQRHWQDKREGGQSYCRDFGKSSAPNRGRGDHRRRPSGHDINKWKEFKYARTARFDRHSGKKTRSESESVGVRDSMKTIWEEQGSCDLSSASNDWPLKVNVSASVSASKCEPKCVATKSETTLSNEEPRHAFVTQVPRGKTAPATRTGNNEVHRTEDEGNWVKTTSTNQINSFDKNISLGMKCKHFDSNSYDSRVLDDTCPTMCQSKAEHFKVKNSVHIVEQNCDSPIPDGDFCIKFKQDLSDTVSGDQGQSDIKQETTTKKIKVEQCKFKLTLDKDKVEYCVEEEEKYKMNVGEDTVKVKQDEAKAKVDSGWEEQCKGKVEPDKGESEHDERKVEQEKVKEEEARVKAEVGRKRELDKVKGKQDRMIVEIYEAEYNRRKAEQEHARGKEDRRNIEQDKAKMECDKRKGEQDKGKEEQDKRKVELDKAKFEHEWRQVEQEKWKEKQGKAKGEEDRKTLGKDEAKVEHYWRKTEQEKAKAEEDRRNIELDKTKVEYGRKVEQGKDEEVQGKEKVELDKEKLKHDKNKVEQEKGKEEGGKAKADDDRSKVELEKTKSEPNRATVEHNKVKVKQSETKSEHGRRKVEYEKEKVGHDEVKEEYRKAKAEEDRRKVELEKANAELNKLKEEQGKAKAKEDITKIEVDEAKAEDGRKVQLDRTKTEDRKVQLDRTKAEEYRKKGQLDKEKAKEYGGNGQLDNIEAEEDERKVELDKTKAEDERKVELDKTKAEEYKRKVALDKAKADEDERKVELGKAGEEEWKVELGNAKADEEERKVELCKTKADEDVRKVERDKANADEDNKKAELDKVNAENKRKVELDKANVAEEKRKVELDKAKTEEDRKKVQLDKAKAEEKKKVELYKVKAEKKREVELDKAKAEEDWKKVQLDKEKEEDEKKVELDKKKSEHWKAEDRRRIDQDKAKLEYNRRKIDQDKAKLEYDRRKVDQDKAKSEHDRRKADQDEAEVEGEEKWKVVQASWKAEIDRVSAEQYRKKAEQDKRKVNKGKGRRKVGHDNGNVDQDEQAPVDRDCVEKNIVNANEVQRKIEINKVRVANKKQFGKTSTEVKEQSKTIGDTLAAKVTVQEMGNENSVLLDVQGRGQDSKPVSTDCPALVHVNEASANRLQKAKRDDVYDSPQPHLFKELIGEKHKSDSSYEEECELKRANTVCITGNVVTLAEAEFAANAIIAPHSKLVVDIDTSKQNCSSLKYTAATSNPKKKLSECKSMVEREMQISDKLHSARNGVEKESTRSTPSSQVGDGGRDNSVSTLPAAKKGSQEDNVSNTLSSKTYPDKKKPHSLKRRRTEDGSCILDVRSKCKKIVTSKSEECSNIEGATSNKKVDVCSSVPISEHSESGVKQKVNGIESSQSRPRRISESRKAKLDMKYEKLFGNNHGGSNENPVYDFKDKSVTDNPMLENDPKNQQDSYCVDKINENKQEGSNVEDIPWKLEKIELECSPQMGNSNPLRRKSDASYPQNSMVQKRAKRLYSLPATSTCTMENNSAGISKEESVASESTLNATESQVTFKKEILPCNEEMPAISSCIFNDAAGTKPMPKSNESLFPLWSRWSTGTSSSQHNSKLLLDNNSINRQTERKVVKTARSAVKAKSCNLSMAELGTNKATRVATLMASRQQSTAARAASDMLQSKCKLNQLKISNVHSVCSADLKGKPQLAPIKMSVSSEALAQNFDELPDLVKESRQGQVAITILPNVTVMHNEPSHIMSNKMSSSSMRNNVSYGPLTSGQSHHEKPVKGMAADHQMHPSASLQPYSTSSVVTSKVMVPSGNTVSSKTGNKEVQNRLELLHGTSNCKGTSTNSKTSPGNVQSEASCDKIMLTVSSSPTKKSEVGKVMGMLLNKPVSHTKISEKNKECLKVSVRADTPIAPRKSKKMLNTTGSRNTDAELLKCLLKSSVGNRSVEATKPSTKVNKAITAPSETSMDTQISHCDEKCNRTVVPAVCKTTTTETLSHSINSIMSSMSGNMHNSIESDVTTPTGNTSSDATLCFAQPVKNSKSQILPTGNNTEGLRNSKENVVTTLSVNTSVITTVSNNVSSETSCVSRLITSLAPQISNNVPSMKGSEATTLCSGVMTSCLARPVTSLECQTSHSGNSCNTTGHEITTPACNALNQANAVSISALNENKSSATGSEMSSQLGEAASHLTRAVTSLECQISHIETGHEVKTPVNNTLHKPTLAPIDIAEIPKTVISEINADVSNNHFSNSVVRSSLGAIRVRNPESLGVSTEQSKQFLDQTSANSEPSNNCAKSCEISAVCSIRVSDFETGPAASEQSTALLNHNNDVPNQFNVDSSPAVSDLVSVCHYNVPESMEEKFMMLAELMVTIFKDYKHYKERQAEACALTQEVSRKMESELAKQCFIRTLIVKCRVAYNCFPEVSQHFKADIFKALAYKANTLNNGVYEDEDIVFILKLLRDADEIAGKAANTSNRNCRITVNPSVEPIAPCIVSGVEAVSSARGTSDLEVVANVAAVQQAGYPISMLQEQTRNLQQSRVNVQERGSASVPQFARQPPQPLASSLQVNNNWQMSPAPNVTINSQHSSPNTVSNSPIKNSMPPSVPLTDSLKSRKRGSKKSVSHKNVISSAQDQDLTLGELLKTKPGVNSMQGTYSHGRQGAKIPYGYSYAYGQQNRHPPGNQYYQMGNGTSRTAEQPRTVNTAASNYSANNIQIGNGTSYGAASVQKMADQARTINTVASNYSTNNVQTGNGTSYGAAPVPKTADQARTMNMATSNFSTNNVQIRNGTSYGAASVPQTADQARIINTAASNYSANNVQTGNGTSYGAAPVQKMADQARTMNTATSNFSTNNVQIRNGTSYGAALVPKTADQARTMNPATSNYLTNVQIGNGTSYEAAPVPKMADQTQTINTAASNYSTNNVQTGNGTSYSAPVPRTTEQVQATGPNPLPYVAQNMHYYSSRQAQASAAQQWNNYPGASAVNLPGQITPWQQPVPNSSRNIQRPDQQPSLAQYQYMNQYQHYNQAAANAQLNPAFNRHYVYNHQTTANQFGLNSQNQGVGYTNANHGPGTMNFTNGVSAPAQQSGGRFIPSLGKAPVSSQHPPQVAGASSNYCHIPPTNRQEPVYGNPSRHLTTTAPHPNTQAEATDRHTVHHHPVSTRNDIPSVAQQTHKRTVGNSQQRQRISDQNIPSKTWDKHSSEATDNQQAQNCVGLSDCMRLQKNGQEQIPGSQIPGNVGGRQPKSAEAELSYDPLYRALFKYNHHKSLTDAYDSSKQAASCQQESQSPKTRNTVITTAPESQPVTQTTSQVSENSVPVHTAAQNTLQWQSTPGKKSTTEESARHHVQKRRHSNEQHQYTQISQQVAPTSDSIGGDAGQTPTSTDVTNTVNSMINYHFAKSLRGHSRQLSNQTVRSNGISENDERREHQLAQSQYYNGILSGHEDIPILQANSSKEKTQPFGRTPTDSSSLMSHIASTQSRSSTLRQIGVPSILKQTNSLQVDKNLPFSSALRQYNSSEAEQPQSSPSSSSRKNSSSEVGQHLLSPSALRQISSSEVEQHVALPPSLKQIHSSEVEQHLPLSSASRQFSLSEVEQNQSVPSVSRETSLSNMEKNFPSPLTSRQTSSSEVEQNLPLCSASERINSPEVEQTLPLCSASERINSSEVEQNLLLPPTSEQTNSLEVESNFPLIPSLRRASSLEVEHNLPLPSTSGQTSSSEMDWNALVSSALVEICSSDVEKNLSLPPASKEASSSEGELRLPTNSPEVSIILPSPPGPAYLGEDELSTSNELIPLGGQACVNDKPDVILLYEVAAKPRTMSRDSGYTTPSPVVLLGTNDPTQIGPDTEAEDLVYCAICDNLAEVICSGCRIQCYCSETCQLMHWNKIHHFECNDQKE